MGEHIISFPGLGIDGFTVKRLAVDFGRINIAWYGVLITLGIVLAVLYTIWRGREAGVDADTVLDFTLVTVMSAVVCARIYFVATTWGDGEYQSFYDVIAIWKGGLAIYGALIGGAIAVYLMCKVEKIRFLQFADMVIPGVMLGQIIGRWGNFTNAEAFGSLIRYDFFGLKFDTTNLFGNLFCRMGIAEPGMSRVVYVHPTFLYESLWNLIGFILINIFYRKRKSEGQVLYWYMAWYGFGRMLIEGFRTDSLYVGSIRISQLVGLVSFLVGVFMMFWSAKHPRPVTKHVAITENQNGESVENNESDANNQDSENIENNENNESEDKTDGNDH